MKKALLFFVSISIAFACSSPKQQETPVIPMEDEPTGTAKEMSNQLSNEADKFDFVLPSPLQIAAIFQRAGLNYAPGITHDIGKAPTYNTEFKMAMNFGVYSTDLSYNVLNGQSQNSIDYLNVVRDLSTNLGLSAIFETEPLLESFEANINNRDSIVYILGKLQRNLDLYLDENDVRYKSVIYFIGAWVEGMYIGANSIDPRNRNAIANRLVEQLSLLENLIKGLTNFPNKTSEYDELISQLTQLRDNMETVAQSGVEEEDGSIKFNVTDENLESLTSQVTSLRNYITN